MTASGDFVNRVCGRIDDEILDLIGLLEDLFTARLID